MTTSYAAQVKTPGDKDWVGNAMRFATRGEAESYVWDLMKRWISVEETNVAGTEDPVNYAWRDGRACPLGDGGAM